MRKWLRRMAHAKMKKAGIQHVNDKRPGGSYFARHWREFI